MTLTALPSTHTAFDGQRLLARGALADVALSVKQAQAARADAAILVFDDQSGKQVDLDLRGGEADIRKRYQAPAATAAPADDADTAEVTPRGRGRPKLGVVPREVTLLPRHWDWLAAQPGGASVALRKLVEQARRECLEMVAVFEAHMAGREFVVGDRLSVADFNAAYVLDWAGEAEMLDAAPQLQAFVRRMYARATAPPTIAEAFAALKS